MIFSWLDEEQTPKLSKTDRMALVLYDLGISNKDQIMRLTGWSKNQIDGAIQRLRKLAETEGGTPGEWVHYWQHRQNEGYVYSLGCKGIRHVRALRGEYTNYRATPLRGHVYHFVGLNDVLIRLLDAGLEVTEWLSSKEVASWMWHSLIKREVKAHHIEEETEKLPLRPDAAVRIGDDERDTFFIEYDCGTEAPIRLEQKFHRYFHLGMMLAEDRMKPVLFVTTSESRKRQAIRAFNRAMESYKAREQQMIVWKDIFFAVEGEEVQMVWDWLAKEDK